MESSINKFKNVDLKKVGAWFGCSIVTPLLQGFFAGTAHLLTLTLLIKYFPVKS